MKRTAFAVWMNRIAPVMDVAGTVCVVSSDGSLRRERRLLALPGDNPSGKALYLSEMGIDALVCGAVSNGLLRLLSSQGIRVVPFVAGNLETVIMAWFEGRLPDSAFVMPGCGVSRRFGKGCGTCVCMVCGHREAHVRGLPCIGRRCPTCGREMKRE